MAPIQLSNQEILRALRYEREHNHRILREIFFYRRPLFLACDFSLSDIALDHIQESCNKPTAIYWTPSPEPRTPRIPGWGLAHSVYDQWFRGHDTDIEFGRFVAKLIAIDTLLGEPGATISDILEIHRKWCDAVAATLPTFGSQEVQADDYERAFSSYCFEKRQHMHYHLQPLFRALIIIYDHTTRNDAEPIVHLVRTGETAGLSAPITFESIKPVVDTVSGLSSDIRGDDTITTTLSSAISFVMALELREQNACTSDKPTDSGVLDENLGSKAHLDEVAWDLGYTGPEIQGPSTDWIKLAEGEEMAPPVTLNVQMARRYKGLDPGPSPWTDSRAKRLALRNMYQVVGN